MAPTSQERPLMHGAAQVAVIMSNPDQSKHLETARMKVAGLEIDLVNLRSESYADQASRIPTMEFGTPEEDALRCAIPACAQAALACCCFAPWRLLSAWWLVLCMRRCCAGC